MDCPSREKWVKTFCFVQVSTWMVGRGSGALLAGLLTKLYGVRQMFIVFGLMGATSFLLYFAAYHMYLKKFEENPNILRKRKESISSENFQDSSLPTLSSTKL